MGFVPILAFGKEKDRVVNWNMFALTYNQAADALTHTRETIERDLEKGRHVISVDTISNVKKTDGMLKLMMKRWKGFRESMGL